MDELKLPLMTKLLNFLKTETLFRKAFNSQSSELIDTKNKLEGAQSRSDNLHVDIFM